MQMNGSGGASMQSEINVTPLVDVVLVLLIIFMVVVPLMMEGYDVNTPRTSAQSAPTAEQEQQVVLRIAAASCGLTAPPVGDGIAADCRVSLDDKEIAAKELPAQIAAKLGGRPAERRVLFLAADDGLNYEGVLRIVDLAKSGVEDLKIGVITTE